MKSVKYRLRDNVMVCSSADVREKVSPDVSVHGVFFKIQDEIWDPIWTQCLGNVQNKVNEEIGE